MKKNNLKKFMIVTAIICIVLVITEVIIMNKTPDAASEINGKAVEINGEWIELPPEYNDGRHIHSYVIFETTDGDGWARVRIEDSIWGYSSQGWEQLVKNIVMWDENYFYTHEEDDSFDKWTVNSSGGISRVEQNVNTFIEKPYEFDIDGHSVQISSAGYSINSFKKEIEILDVKCFDYSFFYIDISRNVHRVRPDGQDEIVLMHALALHNYDSVPFALVKEGDTRADYFSWGWNSVELDE